MYCRCNRTSKYIGYCSAVVAVKCDCMRLCALYLSHVHRTPKIGLTFQSQSSTHACNTALTRLDYKLDRKMVCLTPCIHLIFKTCVSSIIFYARLSYNEYVAHTQIGWLLLCVFFSGLLIFVFLILVTLSLIHQRICPFEENIHKKKIIINSNNTDCDEQKSFYLITN